MKKILALLVLVLTFVSCGKKDSNQADSKELYLFNWSDYLPEEVIKGFEQETGIKVTLDLYSSICLTNFSTSLYVSK